jgi:hypothetical protein
VRPGLGRLRSPAEAVERAILSRHHSGIGGDVVQAMAAVPTHWNQNLSEEVGLLLVVAPRRQTRSPGRMTASRSAFALSGGTNLPVA